MTNKKNILEEGTDLKIDFSKIKNIDSEVIPAVVQDWQTKDVLMLGYINKEALRINKKEKFLTFWSTSRDEIWIKGGSSGSTFNVMDIFFNCEQNSALIIVEAHVKGKGICHTKEGRSFRKTCFYRRLNPKTGKLDHV